MTREIVVLSGKGGTGKTVLAASLVVLAGRVVAADADVESSNLGLLLGPGLLRTEAVAGHPRPIRDPAACDGCGECRLHCHFSAIGPDLAIDAERCEGCGLCRRVCPAGALAMVPRVAGDVRLSRIRGGHLVDAEIAPGGESSGRVVARVREVARRQAEADGTRLVITDGPPGVGCPAISCLAGADRALVVTEPGVAARHDLDRLLDLADRSGVPATLVVNRYDLAPDLTARIEGECAARGVPAAGRIPYDPDVVRAIMKGRPPVGGREGPAARAIRRIADAVLVNEEGRITA